MVDFTTAKFSFEVDTDNTELIAVMDCYSEDFIHHCDFYAVNNSVICVLHSVNRKTKVHEIIDLEPITFEINNSTLLSKPYTHYLERYINNTFYTELVRNRHRIWWIFSNQKPIHKEQIKNIKKLKYLRRKHMIIKYKNKMQL